MINKETYRWATPVNSKDLKETTKQVIRFFFGPKAIAFNLLVVLFIQVRILEGITPFVLPFVAMVPLANMPSIVLVTLIFGFLAQNTNILLTVVSMLAIWTVKRKSNDNYLYSMLSLPLLISFSYMPTLISSTFLSFDLLLLGLQVVMGLTAAYIFKQAMVSLRLDRKEKITLESTICGVIMLGIALSGISTLQVAGISVMGSLSKLAVLLVALTGGVKIAATFGIVIGLLSNFSHPYITYYISFYGFVGLTSGLMNQWRKTGVVLGYICGGVAMFIYSFEFFEMGALLGETLLALTIFLAMPKSAVMKIESIINGEQEEKVYNKQVKDAAIKKIYQFSSIFRELSQGFNQVAVSKLNVEQKSVNEIIDTIQQKACQSCKKHKNCWHNEFYSTYKDIFNMVSLAEDEVLEPSNIPDQLFKKCINTKMLMETTQSCYELHKVNYKWQQRLLESKGLVANQLEGIAKVMENLAIDINLDIGPRKDVEEEIWELLNDKGIECDDIKVTGMEREKPEVQITKKSCGGNGHCENIVSNVVEKRLKTQMCVFKGNCTDPSGECKFVLLSKEKYKMSIGLAQKAHNEVCGDTFSQFSIGNGKHVVILSDGMGKGEKARVESERLVGLIKKMLQVGFDTEKAIKTVNSIMSLRGDEETFATLDIAVVDLYKGKTDIYKNGAATSYIKSNKEIKRIDGSNLPVGMVENIGASMSNHILQKGDFLIMISDGVLDSNPVATDKEGWLTLLLENITSNISPNRLAELILHKSRQRGIEQNLDDLSVVVVKVEGNNQPAVLGRWAIQKGM